MTEAESTGFDELSIGIPDGFNWADAVEEEEELQRSLIPVPSEIAKDPHDEWCMNGLELIDTADLDNQAYMICRELFLWTVCGERTGKYNPKVHFPKFDCPADKKLSQALIESINKGHWRKKGDPEKKYGDGGCYGQHDHSCIGPGCSYCGGTSEIIHACNACAKKRHGNCRKCNNGYIKIKTDTKLCPNIKPNRKCPRCRGKGFYKKDCTGTCPMRQYSSIKNGVLQASCACGRPHRLGDCKRISNGRGREIESPYQTIKMCDDCGHIHPIIKTMNMSQLKSQRNKKERRPQRSSKNGWNIV